MNCDQRLANQGGLFLRHANLCSREYCCRGSQFQEVFLKRSLFKGIAKDNLPNLRPYLIQYLRKGCYCTGKIGKSRLQPYECLHSTQGKLYIFVMVKSSPFQKYTVFHSSYINKDIHLAVVKVSPIFPKECRALSIKRCP